MWFLVHIYLFLMWSVSFLITDGIRNVILDAMCPPCEEPEPLNYKFITKTCPHSLEDVVLIQVGTLLDMGFELSCGHTSSEEFDEQGV